MFRKYFGNNEEKANKIMQDKLKKLFSSSEGYHVLAWLVKLYLIENTSSEKLTAEQIHYQNGRMDFIRLLVGLTNVDLDEYMKDDNGQHSSR